MRPLILEYDTSLSRSVGIPLVVSAAGGYIDWGDGTTSPAVTGWNPHTYPEGAGTVQAKVFAPLQKLWQASLNLAHVLALTKVVDWGDSPLTHVWMRDAVNLVSVPCWLPATVVDLSYTFYGCVLFNCRSILAWVVTQVRNFTCTFRSCHAMNLPIFLVWDMQNAENVQRMIGDCIIYDHPVVGDWRKVTDASDFANGCINYNSPFAPLLAVLRVFRNAFLNCKKFNQPLAHLITNTVEDWQNLINGCIEHAADLAALDVSGGKLFGGMFLNCKKQASDIGNFAMSNATGANKMVSGTTLMNCDLRRWCVPLIPSLPTGFALNSGITPDKYPIWGTCPV